MAKLPTRNEIDPKYRWDLTHIFATQEDWEKALKACEEKVKTFADYEGKVAEDPRAAVRMNFAFQDELMPVIEYAFLSREGDNGDPQAQAMFMRAMGLITQAEAAGAFLEPELLELDDAVLLGMIDDPEMADYDAYLKGLLNAPLTEGYAASLLASLGEVMSAPDNTYGALTNVDMHFPDMELPDGSKEPLTDGTWGYFDMVPGEYEIREGEPDYTGRLCVIGAELKEDKMPELFGL